MAWRGGAGNLLALIGPAHATLHHPGEQATMFFLDPSGNALEFKAFAHDDMIFAT
jgi:extradiol dioxygenase family protein